MASISDSPITEIPKKARIVDDCIGGLRSPPRDQFGDAKTARSVATRHSYSGCLQKWREHLHSTCWTTARMQSSGSETISMNQTLPVREAATSDDILVIGQRAEGRLLWERLDKELSSRPPKVRVVRRSHEFTDSFYGVETALDSPEQVSIPAGVILSGKTDYWMGPSDSTYISGFTYEHCRKLTKSWGIPVMVKPLEHVTPQDFENLRKLDTKNGQCHHKLFWIKEPSGVALLRDAISVDSFGWLNLLISTPTEDGFLHIAEDRIVSTSRNRKEHQKLLIVERLSKILSEWNQPDCRSTYEEPDLRALAKPLFLLDILYPGKREDALRNLCLLSSADEIGQHVDEYRAVASSLKHSKEWNVFPNLIVDPNRDNKTRGILMRLGIKSDKKD